MRSPTDGAGIGIGPAIVLGALHGPAELLPISSSAHLSVLPQLLGWEDAELEGRAFAVALHAGTAAGLAVLVWGERPFWRARGGFWRLILTLVPPVAVGAGLAARGSRQRTAARALVPGLLGGSALMAVAARCRGKRSTAALGGGDALWIGLGQSLALMPGVSRSGATISALRLRGFSPPAAVALSRQAAPAVIAAAAAREALAMRRGGASTLAGAGAAFVSTLACGPALARRELRLVPFAVYRVGLAALLMRLRSTARPSPAARV